MDPRWLPGRGGKPRKEGRGGGGRAAEGGERENSRERRELLVCVWFRMRGVGGLYRSRKTWVGGKIKVRRK